VPFTPLTAIFISNYVYFKSLLNQCYMDAVKELGSGYPAHRAAETEHETHIQRLRSYYYRVELVGSTNNIAD